MSRMKVFRALNEVDIAGDTACAIGMFDGIHPGHQKVLNRAIKMSETHATTSVVLTFSNHPQSVISQTPPLLLTTLEERLAAFDAMGFGAVLLLTFTPELMQLLPDTFVSEILIDTLHVKAVSVGYDHRFGRGRQGDGSFLKLEGGRYGFDVDVIEPVRLGDQIISSTLIRKLLNYGDLEQANLLLGRPYTLTGNVIKGVGRGRSLGFPTANIHIAEDRQIPSLGVYAGWAEPANNSQPIAAVCNIGYAPTFQDQTHVRVEVHLLDFEGDLYETPLTFTFMHKLRDEKAFAGKDDLIVQIRRDCEQGRQLLHAGAVPAR